MTEYATTPSAILSAAGHPGYGDRFAAHVLAILAERFQNNGHHLFDAIDVANRDWYTIGAHHVGP